MSKEPCCCSATKCVWLFGCLWIVAHQALLSSTVSWSLLKFMSIESVRLSNCLILCLPLLLLPSVFPSITVFSNELGLSIRWSKYWSFSFSISPFNEYSGFITFRIHLFDLKNIVMSNSFQPHRLQPTRLLYPWNSPGKNTGVGCH